jgi:hypothetical protein
MQAGSIMHRKQVYLERRETEYGTNQFNCHICSDKQANEESNRCQQTQSVETKPAFAFDVYTGIDLFSIY